MAKEFEYGIYPLSIIYYVDSDICFIVFCNIVLKYCCAVNNTAIVWLRCSTSVAVGDFGSTCCICFLLHHCINFLSHLLSQVSFALVSVVCSTCSIMNSFNFFYLLVVLMYLILCEIGLKANILAKLCGNSWFGILCETVLTDAWILSLTVFDTLRLHDVS